MHASCVFVCDLPRFIQELDPPVFCALQRDNVGRLVTPGINEVELDPSLALATALATVLAVRPCLVAFQMTLSAGQAARPHALGLAAALAIVVAVASVHQIGLGIRLGSYSLYFLARSRPRLVWRSLALVRFRRVRVRVGLVYSRRSRGAGCQRVGIWRTKIRLRVRNLRVVGSQSGQWMARRPGYAPLRGSAK